MHFTIVLKNTFFLVSKTTKELILRWKKDRPVDISSEVKMPQFEISKIDPAKCQETFHIGKYIPEMGSILDTR